MHLPAGQHLLVVPLASVTVVGWLLVCMQPPGVGGPPHHWLSTASVGYCLELGLGVYYSMASVLPKVLAVQVNVDSTGTIGEAGPMDPTTVLVA